MDGDCHVFVGGSWWGSCYGGIASEGMIDGDKVLGCKREGVETEVGKERVTLNLDAGGVENGFSNL